MKKRYHSFLIMSILWGSLITVVCTDNEYDFAKEDDTYQLVLRNALNERIAQKRKTIQERPKQQWLWNTARIVGPLGLMALGAYQWLNRAPTVEQSIQEFKQNNPPFVELLPIIQEETSQHIVQQAEESFVPVIQEHQPLIRADVSKYRQASKAYGAAAVWFTLNALFDPFFYPYVAATYIGSLYYGVKGLRQD